MTRKFNPLKENKQGRKNFYGLCTCRQCKYRRHAYRGKIESLKHKFRNEWKGGREFVRGFFTG